MADRMVAVWWYDLIVDCLAELGFKPPADTFRSDPVRPPACDWERTNALEVARLWLLAEAALGDSVVGLHAGIRASDYTAGHNCPLLRLTCSQPTARQAIETLVRFQLLISDTADLSLESGAPGTKVFRMQPPGLPDVAAAQAVLRHQIDFGFVMMFRLMAGSIGNCAVLREVHLMHGPVDGRGYEEAFECPVRLGASENALVFDDALLDVASVYEDAEVAELLEARAERTVASLDVRPWTSRVCRVLGAPRPSLPSLEEVASSLAVSARTLQRRLSDEDTTFQALFQRVGFELAEQHAGVQPAERVAERLGYSDARAFERAFRRWAGVSFATYAARSGPFGAAVA